MKPHLKKIIFLFLLITVMCFSAKADTIDTYKIYISKTLKITEASYNPRSSNISIFLLDSSNYADTVSIIYNHCTAGASYREIKLTDTTGKIMLQWEFGNKEKAEAMRIPIVAIVGNPLLKHSDLFYMYYRDQEYPEWRMLTIVHVNHNLGNKMNVTGVSALIIIKWLLYLLGVLAVIFIIFKIRR